MLRARAPAAQLPRLRHRRERACVGARASARSTPPSFVARWSIDARFGCKSQALALLGEWVTTVASQAGVAPEEARLLAGQLGAPESRLELELAFESLAELEAFFNALPVAEHAAWGARLAPVVCDGSPMWHVLRSIPLASGAAVPREAAATQPQLQPTLPPVVRRTAGGLFITGSEPLAPEATALEPAPQPDAPQQLDWKGDPIVWAPGDRVPKVAT